MNLLLARAFGLAGFGAAPEARLRGLRGLGALASRLYVYLAGFAALFAMAAYVPPAEFGAYSIYQSVLELAMVAGTLGSSLLFSREAAHVPPGVRGGDTGRTPAIGLPAGILLIAGILALQHLPVLGAPFALLAVTLALFSVISLRLSFSRGMGYAGLLNLEAGIRATVLLIGVAALAALGVGIGASQLLLVNLVALLLVGAASLRTGWAEGPPAGPAALALPAQARATVYALLMFMLRKSDLLVIAFFMPLGYVGAFKIAFLLAEAPSQFVQAFLYTRTRAMLGVEGGSHEASTLQLAKQSLLLGAVLFAGLAVVITLAAPLLKMGSEALEIFLCIAPYFLLRTYTIHHEMQLALKTPMGALGRWALLEVALRLASYAVVVPLFPAKPHYVFFMACLTDFVLYEVRMRRQFGFYPFMRLVRGAPERSTP